MSNTGVSCENFCQAIRGVEDPLVTGWDGHRAYELNVASHLSMAGGGEVVALPLEPQAALAVIGGPEARSVLEMFGREHEAPAVRALATAALRDLDAVVEQDPDFAPGFYNRGVVHMQVERYEEAVRDFTRAIELDPEDAWNYFSRGRILRYFFSDLDGALENMSRAIELDPDYAEAVIEPPRLAFVDEPDELGSVAVMRGKVVAGERWRVSMELRLRLDRELTDAGIERTFVPLEKVSTRTDGYGPRGDPLPEDRDYSLAREK